MSSMETVFVYIKNLLGSKNDEFKRSVLYDIVWAYMGGYPSGQISH